MDVVVEDRVGLSFSVLGPFYAALATDDFWDALHDHRHDQWRHKDPVEYGFAQCLVFASRPREHLGGWAFDTRTPTESGEHSVRIVEDFSGDDGESMSAHWPADPPPTFGFEAWLKERVHQIEETL